MKRLALALLVSLLFVLPGCGKGRRGDTGGNTIPEEIIYHSDTPREDCYLCGGGIENTAPSCWGQNNVALISLNTFEIKPLEINRYDKRNGHLIEEAAGVISFVGGGSQNGGFSANMMLEYDRGYATGSLDFFDDERLDINKAASFLCSDCLNEILPQQIDQCFGVGAILLDTKEIRLFEERISGFGLGDFHFDCNLIERDDGSRYMDLLIFHCPIRYTDEA